MPTWKPLKGMKFGKLTVLEDFRSEERHYHMCKCVCSCSEHTIKDIRACHLISGAIIDCGCGTYERKVRGSTIHGFRHTVFYMRWLGMKARCYNEKLPEYHNYGGRGIKVCTRWLDSFENFKDDMYDSYKEHVAKHGQRNTTLDRVEVDGDYCKENCKWATCEEQNWNKRCNNTYEFNGNSYNTKELAELFGESKIKRLRARLYQHNYDLDYVYNKWYKLEENK